MRGRSDFANPNVYYELAVAQSAGRPVVILIHRGERLPFDLKDFRTLSYDLTITSFTARTYIDRLVAAIQELDRVGWKGDDVFRSYRDGSTEATPNTPSIDALVTRETDERKFMRSAEEQLWLTQETGNLLDRKGQGGTHLISPSWRICVRDLYGAYSRCCPNDVLQECESLL